MLNVLYKYLVLRDQAGLPGIGTFVVNRTPAYFKGSALQPPVTAISFKPGSALTDKNFYHFAAEEEGISEVDAVRKFQDFAYELKKSIQSASFVELTGIGVLKRNGTGEIAFEPGPGPGFLPVLIPGELQSDKQEVVAAEIKEGTVIEEEVQLKKDRWWVWATVLALLALAAIGFFYMQETGF
jgi:hypothetical protein